MRTKKVEVRKMGLFAGVDSLAEADVSLVLSGALPSVDLMRDGLRLLCWLRQRVTDLWGFSPTIFMNNTEMLLLENDCMALSLKLYKSNWSLF